MNAQEYFYTDGQQFPDYLTTEVFDRFNEKGNMLCRNPKCDSRPKRPFHFYCSNNCRDKFTTYYIETCCVVNKVRIATRDNDICRICKKDCARYYEIDHIKPRSIIKKQIYAEFLKLPEPLRKKNFVKFTIKYLKTANDPSNLRTLCRECHRKVTDNFLGITAARRRRKQESYRIEIAEDLINAIQWFNDLLKIENTLIPYIGHHNFR